MIIAALIMTVATGGETLTLQAGSQDRINTPVCLPIAIPRGTQSVQLQHADGRSLVCQLTEPGLVGSRPASLPRNHVARELHFILPELKAGQTLKLTLKFDGPDPAQTDAGVFSWHDTPGDRLDLRFAGKPVLRYMYKPIDESSKESREQTFKVYHHLFDAEGNGPVTKGPGGQFTHHRGLFYGFNRVTYGDGKKADVWHCSGDACQTHEKMLSQEAGPVLGRHRVEIAWRGVGKEVFATEQREVTVYRVPGGQLVEFASQLTSNGPVMLDGDPQHAGFHFRADQEVAAKTNKQTYYLRPDGKGKPGETRNWDPKTKKGPVNLPWNAMSFVLGDTRYTAAYLDRPTNPKEARGSERDYGRFGTYFEYQLTKDKPLAVNYRLWLQKGEMDGPTVARLAGDFVSPVR